VGEDWSNSEMKITKGESCGSWAEVRGAETIFIIRGISVGDEGRWCAGIAVATFLSCSCLNQRRR